ncbi:heterokaryon incompatibility protein-domain-containing protein [Dactylonectria macrodidyma]|uniref:Heterokaryon incompatibility protein-domain-containing protein n=1 Tax=Dactylonectria macrodidyma TaxID=307937 RepID=A0A9P9F4A6_9HYPO|nr:heterokaryon incompatibility protein-domain-containing protein [Dactylonectria macrodidyma]
MRLINVHTFKFEEFFDNAIPEYAIISHTWGDAEDEEVSHEEFLQQQPATKNKAGYLKIQKACHEARERRFDYVWIDTCCIDKTSSAELSEAINSMFRWYEAAEVCFAYLVDVPPATSRAHDLFEASRWFTRGWTLQELLAPRHLDFFASDWTFIANRKDIASRVCIITNIDEVYLIDSAQATRTSLLRKASIAERMSWASRRTATREEDVAYSLLGIFGVNMPLIYGEGAKAFLRLQEEIMRSAFDPTLLCWDAEVDGKPQLRQGAKPFYSWTSAFKALLGLEYPWQILGPLANSKSPTGHLAPGPECFRHCKDFEPYGTVVDWVATNRGLEITLPKHPGGRPYIAIPCHLRHDPWNLLAIPLVRGGGTGYWRSSGPTMLGRHGEQ